MQSLLPAEVDAYLTELVKARQVDPVLDDMERRAETHGFPIVGRSVGRFLEVQARMIGARRVVELGSGYGYSAYWFAGAVGADGEVVCTDHDPDNAALAEDYLRRAGRWEQVRYHVGDALEGLAAVDGELDIVYGDIHKEGYPAMWAAAAERIRLGGLFLCDNVLWDGRVAGLDPRAEFAGAERDAATAAIVRMTREVAQDPRYLSAINPVRDGVLVAMRVR
ncbi:MAG: O-methyltransferase [Nitriliruptoraceae bacterium]